MIHPTWHTMILITCTWTYLFITASLPVYQLVGTPWAHNVLMAAPLTQCEAQLRLLLYRGPWEWLSILLTLTEQLCSWWRRPSRSKRSLFVIATWTAHYTLYWAREYSRTSFYRAIARTATQLDRYVRIHILYINQSMSIILKVHTCMNSTWVQTQWGTVKYTNEHHRHNPQIQSS